MQLGIGHPALSPVLSPLRKCLRHFIDQTCAMPELCDPAHLPAKWNVPKVKAVHPFLTTAAIATSLFKGISALVGEIPCDSSDR